MESDGVNCLMLERPERRCLVNRDRRCPYFERAVLPAADQQSPPDDLELQAKREEARRTYNGMHNLKGAVEQRSCPECGGPVPKHHHRCETCARKRRLRLARERVRKHRGPVTL